MNVRILFHEEFLGGTRQKIIKKGKYLSNKYALLTKRVPVKMAGYWPSSLLAFLSVARINKSIKDLDYAR